jgi:pyruvate-ferredoxin/flavodoxin oxidoreductase
MRNAYNNIHGITGTIAHDSQHKIAEELTAFVMHVTARSLATHGLSVFGDRSDVMTCRQTGFSMLASNTGQEALDMAYIAHAVT